VQWRTLSRASTRYDTTAPPSSSEGPLCSPCSLRPAREDGVSVPYGSPCEDQLEDPDVRGGFVWAGREVQRSEQRRIPRTRALWAGMEVQISEQDTRDGRPQYFFGDQSWSTVSRTRWHDARMEDGCTYPRYRLHRSGSNPTALDILPPCGRVRTRQGSSNIPTFRPCRRTCSTVYRTVDLFVVDMLRC
jgi:hypothetical protein